MKHIQIIAAELAISADQVSATVRLLDEGSTVPFIARYRKEITGSLDDLQVASIRDRIQQLRELDARREVILKSIKEQEKLSPELERKINAAQTLTELEDLYLPYRPKRKTRASVAREKGLEPLALILLQQKHTDPSLEAEKFIDEEKGITNEAEALQGARDIIAEMVSEHAETRQRIRTLFLKKGTISSSVLRGKESEAAKYKDYFEWEEPVGKVPSHRLLAMRRGEKEMYLSLNVAPPEEEAIHLISREFLKGSNAASEQVELALTDGYKRLLKPSIETEIRMLTKKAADEEAIRVFAENLKQLLLAAPLGQKRMMAIDPGFRTGCKLVCLDNQGKLLEYTAIFPNAPQNEQARAGTIVQELIKKYQVEAIAIGNGTASRETDQFIRSLDLGDILVAVVNESGASIYSASEVAREEFPNHDVTVRGAVSIGRRLMDPLAELVKIDAKSIGVGQYQHDVDQGALKHSLDDVVTNCVNKVGVELNTASKELLTYVSGLGPQLATNIVNYRNENGPFTSREELKKVPRLGGKAFEQAAGFLRIREAKNPLDQSAVHPERYALVNQMARDMKASVGDLMSRKELRNALNLDRYVNRDVGIPTLQDIMEELAKPGRDPRERYEAVKFQDGVNEMTDLKIGMSLVGVVTNITKFGAFVDVGVHQDGLVHISELSDSFVSDPAQVVKLGQKVTVKVKEVDIPRKRISLSMKRQDTTSKKSAPKPKRKESPYGSKQSNNQKESRNPDGDLQAKLAMLKGKWG